MYKKILRKIVPTKILLYLCPEHWFVTILSFHHWLSMDSFKILVCMAKNKVIVFDFCQMFSRTDRVITKLNLHSQYYLPWWQSFKKPTYRPLLSVKSQVDVCKASDVQWICYKLHNSSLIRFYFTMDRGAWTWYVVHTHFYNHLYFKMTTKYLGLKPRLKCKETFQANHDICQYYFFCIFL